MRERIARIKGFASKHAISARALATGALVGGSALMPTMSAWAVDGSTLTTDVGTLTGLLSSVTTVFTIFPINLFLAGGIAGIVFKLLGQGKRAATPGK